MTKSKISFITVYRKGGHMETTPEDRVDPTREVYPVSSVSQFHKSSFVVHTAILESATKGL